MNKTLAQVRKRTCTQLLPAVNLFSSFKKNCFIASFLLMAIATNAQNLTLSNAGQTGTSGTNWTTSGTNPVTITVTGVASINTSVIEGYLNAGTSVIVNNTTTKGTALNSAISKTNGGNASLTLKDIGCIKVAAGISISSTTGTLDIIFWADSDLNQGGAIDDFIVCNSGSSFNSNGGKIVMAGGADNGANGGVSGDAVPDEFAWNGSNTTTYGANVAGGLSLGLPAGTGTVISLNSSGGDIILRGSTSNNNGYPGITSQGSLKIESGTGKITIYGKSTTGHGIELTYGASPNIAINSSATSSPAIDIKGIASVSGIGLFMSNNASGNILIQSTAATGGGITLEGVGTGNIGLILGAINSNIATQVLSQSGPITLKGKGTSGSYGSIFIDGNGYIGNRKDATAIQGITPSVTASTANILLQGDAQYNISNSSGKNSYFNSTGALTIKAYTAGYTGTVSWIGNVNIGASFSSITLGEAAENYSLAVNNSLTANGNITAYANNFTLADGVGIASSTNGNVSINAKGDFISTGTTRRTISSIGGNINVYADADANGAGQMDIDYMTFNPGSGNLKLRTETMGWVTTTNPDKPYLNGTGTITIEPSDGSFQAVQTNWFYFDQDANGMAGLTIGKSTNYGDLSVQNNPLTVAGPISLYGGLIALSVNLTSSATGDIFIKSNSIYNGFSINATASILKTAGTGTLTMQCRDRVTTGTITASGTAILNVVIWSDYENDNHGGVNTGPITTNGGNVWIGGSNSNGGSYTWKGLTVGDGPSVGASTNNWNAIDFYNSISTNGGDVLIWGGNGYGGGISGIGVQSVSSAINAGSGNITLIGDNIGGNDITITTTGVLSLVPDGGSYPAAVTWSGSLSGGNFNVTNTYDRLLINNFANLGGLAIGYCDSQILSGTPVKQTNTSDILVSTASSIAGLIKLYGTNLTINQNLASTGSGDISLIGNTLTIAGATTLTSAGNLIIEPITNGTTIGLAGTGTLSLTATHFTTNFTDGFSEIRIGNTSAGNITLGAALTMRDNLRLSTGGTMSLNQMLDIGNNNFRFIGSSISPSANKYVKTNGTGKLYMDIANTASTLFPIGTAYYNPVTITNNTGASDVFNATVSDNIYTNGSSSGTAVLWNPKINLTWNIGNTGASTGAGNVDLTFGWNAANVFGIFIAPRLLHYSTGWSLLPGIPTFNLGMGTMTYTGFSGSLFLLSPYPKIILHYR